jgi:putative transcriptional regulator
MAKKMSELAEGIAAGLKDAIGHARGIAGKARTKRYVSADAKAIRERLGMSQREFAHIYGIPLDTLQNWEQCRTYPDRTASAYLWAIDGLPEQISEVQLRLRVGKDRPDLSRR